MIVSFKHKFIFIKTRKTAGSSIEGFLRQFLGPDDIASGLPKENYGALNTRLSGHTAHATIRKLVKKQEWQSFYKFALERNPWDKVVSDFLFKKRRKYPDLETKKIFPSYLKEWVETKNISDWNRYTHTGEPVANMFKFEELYVAMQEICNIIDVPYSNFETFHFKQTPDRQHYSHYYNDEQKELVANAFNKEITYFNYSYKNEA